MKYKGLFVLGDGNFEKIYEGAYYDEIAALVDIYAPPMTTKEAAANPEILVDCEIIFSGWGAPIMDENFLQHVPNLKFVFYGAGSIRYMVTDAFWDKGIRVCSAWGANAVPVTEYCLAGILFGLKRVNYFDRLIKANRGIITKKDVKVFGSKDSTVGIVALSMVGKKLCKRLEPFDLDIIAYDPYHTQDEADEYGAKLVSLEEVFADADVVSVNVPWLPETVGMITGELIASMKEGATFINSARGAVVKEQEMIDVLKSRPDIQALIDVTYPEPAPPESGIYDLDNVILTPHIAGPMAAECDRQAEYMIAELKAFLNNTEFEYEVTREKIKIMA